MQTTSLQPLRVLAFAVAGLIAAGPVFADKPAWAGDKKEKHERKRDKQDEREGDQDKRREGGGAYFTERQRAIAHDYYVEQFRRGRCPPGLAKKNNGCMPPGQAKKWVVGRPLPREVIYYEVPQPVVVQLGPPPSGQRYVRVSSDILLIAVATGIVLDALQELHR